VEEEHAQTEPRDDVPGPGDSKLAPEGNSNARFFVPPEEGESRDSEAPDAPSSEAREEEHDVQEPQEPQEPVREEPPADLHREGRDPRVAILAGGALASAAASAAGAAVLRRRRAKRGPLARLTRR
jgi:hypothetical protein